MVANFPSKASCKIEEVAKTSHNDPPTGEVLPCRKSPLRFVGDVSDTLMIMSD